MNLYQEEWIPYSYWLDQVNGIGSRSMRKILKYYGNAKAVYELSDRQLESEEMKKLLTGAQTEQLRLSRYQLERQGIGPRELYQRIQKKGIRCIPFGTEAYPQRLQNLSDSPVNLYVSGSLPKENVPTVGIVGARLCSDYGRYMARQFGMQLGRAGIQIISGLANGVDGISQKGVVDAGGSTYAVLGCGVDICYPEENQKLYDSIPEHGGIISEYPPGTRPVAGLFPMRNRIISGLSDLLLVIEAKKRSGTLITVDQALEQGREVYALPGRVTDALSYGCNHLIRQGAGIAMSPEDILEAVQELWGISKSDAQQENVGSEKNHPLLTEQENRIWRLLDFEGKTLDEIESSLEAQKISMEISELSILLMELSLKSFVCWEQGRYRRKG